MSNVPVGIGNIKNIIAVGSGKGGVGKSTVSANLAQSLAKKGFNVGLLDADLYGPCQPGMMGELSAPKGNGNIILPVEKDGVKFVSMGQMNPSGKALIIRSPLAIKAIQQFLSGVQWGELDYLLIDLPPGTGDIQLTLAQQAHLTGAVIVTTPQRVASDIAKKGLEMFETVNVPVLGVVENMSGYKCHSCGTVNHVFGQGGGSKLTEQFNVPLLGQIPLDPEIMTSADSGIIDYQSDSDYVAIFNSIVDSMNEQIDKSNSEAKEWETKEIAVTDTGLKIDWADNTSTEIQAHKLRYLCPCAQCVNEHTGERMIKPEQIPATIKVLGVRPVGRYGISVNFSDGHGTGIYKYKNLKAFESDTESFSV